MISVAENRDCMEAMKEFPDNFFDLAIVDPPYGSKNILGGYTSGKGGGLAKQKNYHRKLWNQLPPDQCYFYELTRVSKNQIIWGANHFVGSIPDPDSPAWIVWDKDNGDVSFADCELAWTSFETAVRRFKYRWAGMLQQDMKNKEVRIHDAQKPVALYKWILKNYGNGGGKILDTHLGSGSSRIAAHNMGFDFWGYEIDPDYFRDQEKRFKQHISQLKLL